jgi:hypothetical protein
MLLQLLASTRFASLLTILLLSTGAWLALSCANASGATDPFRLPQGRIFLVTSNQSSTLSPAPLATALLEHSSGITAAARLMQHGFGTPAFVQSAQISAREPQLYFADQPLFQMFPFSFIEGNPHNALTQPNTVVISAAMAQKYFPHSCAIGQILRLDNRFSLTITGVITDVPSNAAFNPEFLVSFSTNQWAGKAASWSDCHYPTLLQLAPDANMSTVESALQEIIGNHSASTNHWIHLQPLETQHPETISGSFSPAQLRASRLFSWLIQLITPGRWS